MQLFDSSIELATPKLVNTRIKVREFTFKVMGQEIDAVIDELDTIFGESFSSLSIYTKRALLAMAPSVQKRKFDPQKPVTQKLVDELTDFPISISPVTNVIGRARGEQILKSLRKSGQHFKVLSFDVAALKFYNEYGIGGPNAGDLQLKLNAMQTEIFLNKKYGNFLLIHWGGDEFIIIIFDGELDEDEFSDFISDNIDTTELVDVSSPKVIQAFAQRSDLFGCDGIDLLKMRLDYLTIRQFIDVRALNSLTWLLFNTQDFTGFGNLYVLNLIQLHNEFEAGNLRLRESDLELVYEDKLLKLLAKEWIPQPKIKVFCQTLDSSDMVPGQCVVQFVNYVPLIKENNPKYKAQLWKVDPKRAYPLDVRLDHLSRRAQD
jgi:GGDEF domain-containing protein